MRISDWSSDVCSSDLFTPVWPRSDVSARAAYAQACERLADVAQDFERALPQRRDVIADLDELPEPAANMTRDDFHAMVRKAKEYILAGDIFQVVLSQRLSLPFRQIGRASCRERVWQYV